MTPASPLRSPAIYHPTTQPTTQPANGSTAAPVNQPLNSGGFRTYPLNPANTTSGYPLNPANVSTGSGDNRNSLSVAGTAPIATAEAGIEPATPLIQSSQPRVDRPPDYDSLFPEKV